MLDLPTIRRRLSAFEPAPVPTDPDTRQAAVAVVLREAGGATEVLFIQRAEQAGDPWSGHMAFPGGHRDPADADLRAAAVRETSEEIGLDISTAPLLGELPTQRPMSARRDLLVAPFVFEIAGDPTFALNHEVAEAIWAPLDPMHRGRSHDTGRPGGTAMAFNGFRLPGGHFVWGMTYRMVQTFFETLDPGYRRRPE